MNKTIYLDFDGTVANSKKRMCEIYNRYYTTEHESQIDYEEVTTWSAGISDGKIVEEIFGHPKFHSDELEIFENCLETLRSLKRKGWKIVLYTKGILKNIHHKSAFVEKYMPNILDGWIFVGSENVSMGKSQYDMSPAEDGDITVLLDDHIKNLTNSGALYSVCARLCGTEEEWNKDWNGIAFTNWNQVEKLLDNFVEYEKLVKTL